MAIDAYLKLDGIDGEVTVKGYEKTIKVLGFEWEVVSPRDPQSGLPTGKRMHKPFNVTVASGATSPLIFQAIAGNKVIKTGKLTLLRAPAVTAGKGGELEAYLVYDFKNISVSDFSEGAPAEAVSATAQGVATVRLANDKLSLSYQTITLTSSPSKNVATDDWESKV